MAKQPHAYNKDNKLNCDDSIHYKLEICKILVGYGSYKDANTCLHDKSVLPSNVKNGGVD